MSGRDISNGLSLVQLKQLRELHWLEDSYNILFAGPSGVGDLHRGGTVPRRHQTRIPRGLPVNGEHHRDNQEKRHLIRGEKGIQDIDRRAQVIVIDDIMNVTVDRDEGNMLFAFINSVYKTTSFIITTNNPRGMG